MAPELSRSFGTGTLRVDEQAFDQVSRLAVEQVRCAQGSECRLDLSLFGQEQRKVVSLFDVLKHRDALVNDGGGLYRLVYRVVQTRELQQNLCLLPW